MKTGVRTTSSAMLLLTVILCTPGNPIYAQQTPAIETGQAWTAKTPPNDTPLRAYSCRIVSYAGKWTRHGFGNYMTWRYPSGQMAPDMEWEAKFAFAQDFDVDGDGDTQDDYVASLLFSMDRPLSNPDWPMHQTFPQRRSRRFYGGVSWCIGNSQPGEAKFYREMGYNPDHSPPWYDTRAEDHPLQGEANERKADSVLRMYWAILWKKEDFLNDGNKYRVTFDDTSRLASITTRNYWLGYDDVRMIVQDGEQLYISDNKQFDIPKNGYKPAIGRVFLCHPTKAMWAKYNPRGHLMNFDRENASFEKHDFKDVQAVGWYLAKDNPDGQQAHVKWYGFEADAIVHRPEQGSVNIDMVEVPASDGVPEFWMSTCEVPYAKWKDVHRYGDAPFHTLEARYVYLKDGDMGSMLFGNKSHGPDEPATNFTWWDALAWCNTLSEMEGKTPCYYVDPEFKEAFRNMEFATRATGPTYEERNMANPTFKTVPAPSIHVKWDADGHRLPTVSEWLAALGASKPGGLQLDTHAWTRINSEDTTRPVGMKRSNALGVYDMIGNVWELCWSYGDVFDPEMMNTYVAMGGDFNYPDEPCSADSAASAYGDEPSTGNYNIGLRVVCRRPGLPKPATKPVSDVSGDGKGDVPVWQFRKGEKTSVRKTAKPGTKPILEMAKLPGGQFLRHPEKNMVAVSAFDIAKYSTTYRKWKQVLQWAEANGYSFSKTGDMGSMYFFHFSHSPDEPVINITWHDMLVWCNALSEMEGRTPCFYTDEACTQVYRNAFMYRPLKVSGPELVAAAPHRFAQYSYLTPQPWIFTKWDVDGYRLPTEAEYEYALRGDTQTRYFWGDDETQAGNYTWNIANAGGTTHPVGQKDPNPFGLYDMQGNVHQWLYSIDRNRVKIRPPELDTNNPKQSPYWSYKQPKEIYYRLASPLVAGGSWLYGRFNIYGPHGVTVEPQNAINTVLYYADVGFRVVRCEAGKHPRNGKEKMLSLEDIHKVVLDIDPTDYDPLQGATFRGNLLRNGVYLTNGVPILGCLKWKAKLDGPVKGSPVMAGGIVYVGSEGNHYYAIDAETGQEVWRLPIEGGSRSSACICNGNVYFGGNDGNLYAVDAKNGEVIWKRTGKGKLTSSPGVAYGVVFMEGTWGFDVKTGKKIWATRKNMLSGSGEERLSSVAILPETIYENSLPADIRRAYYTRRKPSGWANQNVNPTGRGFVLDSNTGVGGAVNLPVLRAIDLETRQEHWTKTMTLPGQPDNIRYVFLCSPAIWEDRVYVGFDGGRFWALDARTGKEAWHFDAPDAIRSAPSVSAQDSIVYFGCNDGHLYALDAQAGQEKWKFKTGGKVTSSPSIYDGVIYVGSNDGCLYALE